MTIHMWIEENHQKLVDTCFNITKSDDYMDIHQMVVLSLLERSEILDAIPDKEKLYYYIGAVRRQFFSDSSKYFQEYKKLMKKSIEVIDDIQPDAEYSEGFTWDFVFQELEKLSWFERDLFMLLIELKTVKAVSQQTTIPVNSVSKYIKKIKKQIITNYKKQL